MNESGELNLARFEKYLAELSKYDYDHFQKENDPSQQLRKSNTSFQNKSELDSDQIPNTGFSIEIMQKLMITPPINSKKQSNSNNESDANSNLIDSFIANERKPVNELSSSSSSDDVQQPTYPDADDDGQSSDSEQSSDIDNERKKILRMSSGNNNDADMLFLNAKFRQHKNEYYCHKMKSGLVTTEQIQMYGQQYLEALQWILKYYYQGCPSWSWFYPHHYAPYLSDLTNFKHLQFTFHKGTPFKPFEQLLGKY